MSELKVQEHAIPVGPLKIAALEGCRDFARDVDRYLVNFRHNSPMHTGRVFPHARIL